MLLVVPQLNEHLEPLNLNPWRVLVIAAHPGDIERGASAVAARWIAEGAEVIYLIATRGELSLPGVEPADAALIRSGEQSAAAAAVGVRSVDFLDVDDGTVEPSIQLRRAIVRDIRHFRPDVVMTMNHREYEPDGALNDPDHRAVGITALDAVRSAGNQWAFRDVGEAHIVDVVLVAASPMPTHAIDVSAFEADAVRAFSAHEQHLAAVAEHPLATTSWLTSTLRECSDRLPGSTAALAVERIDYAHSRPCHSFIVKEFVDTDGQMQIMKLSGKSERSKTPRRARNTAPTTPTSPLPSSPQPQPQPQPKGKSPVAKAKPPSANTDGAMKFKVRLEQRGRSIGVEIPLNVMTRLGAGQRPDVNVEINDVAFETTISSSGGKPFVAINAERRKSAGIQIDDAFFIALSARANIAHNDKAKDAKTTEPTREKTPKTNRRKRSPRGPHSKA